MRPPDLWTRRDLASRLVVALLTPFGWLHGASVAYREKFGEQYRSSAKVVCVGNLTVGGTGKTPIALEIARMLIARGMHPVFLSRGHGGRARGPVFVTASDLATEVGDEPLLLASIAPVIIARDRAAGARLAETSGFDVVIMDDGHQNFSLTKDLALVVVDAESGFGNNRVLPAGPLREPVARGLRRADAVIITGEADVAMLSGTERPLIRALLLPAADPVWVGMRVVAFAGIGRPDKFFSSLERIGVQLVETCPYDDHHFYTPAEIASLRAKADAKNAVLVTTEKDFVRLLPAQRHGISTLHVDVKFSDDKLLERLLDNLVPRALPPHAQ